MGGALEMTTSYGGYESRGALRYLHAFRVHWLIILTLAVLAVVAAQVVTRTATKKFVASADLQIQALPAYAGDPFQGFDVFRQSVDGSSPTIAAARVFGSPQYANSVYHRYGTRRQAVALNVTPLSQ